jgi:hypothetical protein
MTQTPEGAKKAAETLRKRYGKNFYGAIGAIGGHHGKGVHKNKQTRKKLSQAAIRYWKKEHARNS